MRTVAKPGQAPTGSGSKPDHGFCSSHTLQSFVLGRAGFLSHPWGRSGRRRGILAWIFQEARLAGLLTSQDCRDWQEPFGTSLGDRTEAQGEEACPRVQSPVRGQCMSSNSQARLFLGYWWLRGQAVDGVHRLPMTDLGSNSGSAVHWLRDLTSLHGLSEPQFLHL